MPHIVLDRKINLFEFSTFFTPVLQKSPLIRISTIFVEKNGLTALLPVVVIDEKHQEFFIQLSTTSQKTTIRLLPITDPLKTSNVKISMVKVYDQIKKWNTDVSISKTNLSEFIGTGITS